MTSRASRTEVATHGMFHSVPGAFPTAPASLRHALKLEFAARPVESSDNGVKLEPQIMTDRVLIDLGELANAEIDPKVLVRDCELIIDIAKKHPDALRRIFSSLGSVPLGDVAQVVRIAQELKSIGFTEEAATEQGGGFFLIILAIAALAAAGCAHCAPGGAAAGKGTTPSPRPR